MAETFKFGTWYAMDRAPTNSGVIVYAGTDQTGSNMHIGEAYHHINSKGEDEGWWWANTMPNDFDQIYPIAFMPMPAAPRLEVA